MGEEDDVLKELDELIGDVPMKNEESHEEIPELPSVPSDKLPEKKVEREQKSKATKEKVLLEAS